MPSGMNRVPHGQNVAVAMAMLMVAAEQAHRLNSPGEVVHPELWFLLTGGP